MIPNPLMNEHGKKELALVEHALKVKHVKQELSRYFTDKRLSELTDHWMNYFEIANKDIRQYDFIELHEYNDYERKTERRLLWKKR